MTCRLPPSTVATADSKVQGRGVWVEDVFAAVVTYNVEVSLRRESAAQVDIRGHDPFLVIERARYGTAVNWLEDCSSTPPEHLAVVWQLNGEVIGKRRTGDELAQRRPHISSNPSNRAA